MSCSGTQGRAGFTLGTFNLKLLGTFGLVRRKLRCSLRAPGT